MLLLEDFEFHAKGRDEEDTSSVRAGFPGICWRVLQNLINLRDRCIHGGSIAGNQPKSR